MGRATALTAPEFHIFDAVPNASTIMLVADDTPYRKLLGALVEYLGFTPHIAAPGRDAVDYARETMPAVILMSICETEETVIDTAVVIRAHLRDRTPPLVALVDSAHPKRRAALEGYAFDAVEVKLFDIASLEDLLEGLICIDDTPRH